MKHKFHTVSEILDRKIETPIDLANIPNHMGINLCSVEAVSWTEQDDGQLVSCTIHFLPGADFQCKACGSPLTQKEEGFVTSPWGNPNCPGGRPHQPEFRRNKP